MTSLSQPTSRSSIRHGLLAVGGGALLWGTTGVPVAIIHERTGLSAVPIGALRLLVAAIAVAVVFNRSLSRRVRAAVTAHGWWLVAAGVGLATYQALYFVGIQYVGVGVSTLVSLAVAPVALTVWTSFARRRLPGGFQVFVLSLAVAGLVMVSLRPGTGGGAHPLVGLLASLAAGLGYAASTVVNHRIAGGGDPLLLTGISSGIGCVVLLIVAAPLGLRWPTDGIASGWLVYIGVVTTVVAYWLFYLGLRSVASETAGVVTLLEPLAAAGLAAAVLHERLTTLGLIGAVLMLAAIAGLYLRVPEEDVAPR